MIVRIASVQVAPERIDEWLATIERPSTLYTSSVRDWDIPTGSLIGTMGMWR